MSQAQRYLKTQLAKLPDSAGASRANRIAQAAAASGLVTSVICGANSQESFAKLAPDGSWQRMYSGCSQVTFLGFTDEFLETWPEWGMMRAGECFPLSTPARFTDANVFLLSRTPMAGDARAWMCSRRDNVIRTVLVSFDHRKQISAIYIPMLCGYSASRAADFTETMMGFPPRWTDLNATAMP